LDVFKIITSSNVIASSSHYDELMTKLHLHAMTEYEHNIEKLHLNLQKKEDAFHNQKKGKILLVDDEPNTCMGFQIVLKYCLGHEFDEDKKDFKQKYGRSASQDEEPYILTPLMSYDKDRKGRFIDCIKKKPKHLWKWMIMLESKSRFNCGLDV
jgi:hypothetical protein